VSVRRGSRRSRVPIKAASGNSTGMEPIRRVATPCDAVAIKSVPRMRQGWDATYAVGPALAVQVGACDLRLAWSASGVPSRCSECPAVRVGCSASVGSSRYG
jgi:hypothetical protein